jgi:hypothetical protein
VETKHGVGKLAHGYSVGPVLPAMGGKSPRTMQALEGKNPDFEIADPY